MSLLTPALDTSTSTGPPKCSSTAANAVSTSADDVTSHLTPNSPSGGSDERYVTATRSPAAAKRWATARPMPREPPVTRTMRPAVVAASWHVGPRPSAARRWPRSCRRRSRRAARGRRRCTRPASRASARASGIDADDVLPVRSSTTAARSMRMPRRSQAAAMMRVLAWCGTIRAMSSIGDAGGGHRLLGRVDHDPHGPPEDLLAVHLDDVADLGVEEALGAAVGVEVPPEQLARRRRRPRAPRRPDPSANRMAVLRSSQSTMRASVSVPMTRTRSAPMAIRPWAVDEAVREAGAGGVDVEGAAADAELGGDGGRRRRHRAVGRRGGQHDGVERRRVEAGHADGLAGRLGRQAGGGAADVALVDAGALADPLVARVQAHVLEVLVGQRLGRQGGAPAGDHGAPGAGMDGRHVGSPFSWSAARRSAGGT